MADIAKAEEIIRIANETLVIDTGTDWVAIIALAFSILSTIAILIWQNYLRKKDKEEQIERIKKEDKIRQWNALYPYRIKFYTDFYDTLFQFVNYQGKQSSIPDATLMDDVIVNMNEINIFLQKFNKFAEEAKVLFNARIQKDVKKVYLLVNDFVQNPYSADNTKQQYVAFIGANHLQKEIKENLKNIQENIKNLKLDTDLRQAFKQFLTMEGNKDE